jgi:hypothetical protein
MAKSNIVVSSDMFLNLSKQSAQNLAEAKNMIFQLVSIDGESFFSYPDSEEPVRTDRVYVEIEKGKVVKASIQ